MAEINWNVVVYSALIFAFVMLTIVGFFRTTTDNTVKLEVVGITNTTNATTLTQIHYECIKFCSNKYGQSDTVRNCYAQCAILGRE